MEIVSPHDPQARYSHKPGKAEWVGYKDHQTGACDEGLPNVIVHVATTPAPEQDIDALDRIHADLATHGHAPAEHLVDGGYVTPATIHRARAEYGIDLIGPVRLAPTSRAHPGFNKEDFLPNWQEGTRRVECRTWGLSRGSVEPAVPAGQLSTSNTAVTGAWSLHRSAWEAARSTWASIALAARAGVATWRSILQRIDAFSKRVHSFECGLFEGVCWPGR